ncbi:MAG: VirB3 family type IV secretion system protein [bacterium]
MTGSRDGESRRPGAHVIHASLLRPVLFMGVEPPVAVLEVTTVFALLFVVGFHLVTVVLAVIYLVGVHGVMAWAAQHDPQMTVLYVRSLSARDFYHARAPLLGPPERVRQSIPAKP